MTRLVTVAALELSMLIGCSTTEWVHPNKPKGAFAMDYNTCENAAYQDPKQQGGMKMIIQQNVERCLIREGWVLRETR